MSQRRKRTPGTTRFSLSAPWARAAAPVLATAIWGDIYRQRKNRRWSEHSIFKAEAASGLSAVSPRAVNASSRGQQITRCVPPGTAGFPPERGCFAGLVKSPAFRFSKGRVKVKSSVTGEDRSEQYP